jgi:hypothetical protein
MNPLAQAANWSLLPWLPLIALAILGAWRARRSFERELRQGSFEVSEARNAETGVATVH